MGKSAPKTPDPIQTANAQTQSNKDTAVAQTGLNAQNQVTPYGNLTYTQNGTWDDGTPKFTATTTLSPAQQALLDSNQQTQLSLANTAQTQAGRLDGLLSQPFSLDNDAVEGRLMELGRSRLDPMLADRRQSTEANLLDRGIRPGSDAYYQAQTIQNQGENDAYNSLLLSGRGQAVSEALAERNQPINEIIGLSSGTQVQQPGFASTPQTGVAGTDVAGITQAGYNNSVNQYNQQQQQLGGLFGTVGNVASAALPFILSDRRAKKNVEKVGKLPDGTGVYDYEYKGGGPRQRGFMAQDVRKHNPGAVARHPKGLLMVNYGKVVNDAMGRG